MLNTIQFPTAVNVDRRAERRKPGGGAPNEPLTFDEREARTAHYAEQYARTGRIVYLPLNVRLARIP